MIWCCGIAAQMCRIRMSLLFQVRYWFAHILSFPSMLLRTPSVISFEVAKGDSVEGFREIQLDKQDIRVTGLQFFNLSQSSVFDCPLLVCSTLLPVRHHTSLRSRSSSAASSLLNFLLINLNRLSLASLFYLASCEASYKSA
ncbi:hypothetical protein R1flu_015612 [Riccia fluitans]|uniref:Uncharacterized protein n=1 Tax=Riccia fluitans TaxID=41844 RepID=A0ABD1YJH1_9MARC